MTVLGKLYLVPTPLDFGAESPSPITSVLPVATLQISAQLTHWLTENAKTTRAFLKRVDEACPLCTSLQQIHIQELPRDVHKKGDHSPTTSPDLSHLLAPAIQCQNMGLVSEAGMPAVADPGSSVVRAAHALNIRIVPLVGPVSLLLALAASGLNGQNFAFVGYLPTDAAARNARIRELEATALKTGQTQICIETPYRNAALLQALLGTLKGNTRLAICSGLTLPSESIRSASVANWRSQALTLPTKEPAVFAFGA
jgi:16S rRNA (cytidine1402-2'-O)-methyltransferase